MKVALFKKALNWKSVEFYQIVWQDVGLDRLILGFLGFLKKEAFIPESVPSLMGPSNRNLTYSMYRHWLYEKHIGPFLLPPFPPIRIDFYDRGTKVEYEGEGIFLFKNEKDMKKFIEKFVLPDPQSSYPIVREMAETKFKKLITKFPEIHVTLPYFPAVSLHEKIIFFEAGPSLNSFGAVVSSPLDGLKFPSILAKREEIARNTCGVRIIFWDGSKRKSWVLNPQNISEGILRNLIGGALYDVFEHNGKTVSPDILEYFFSLPPLEAAYLLKLPRNFTIVENTSVSAELPKSTVILPAYAPVSKTRNIKIIDGPESWWILTHTNGILFHPDFEGATFTFPLCEDNWFWGARLL